jgi:hypothetical protein
MNILRAMGDMVEVFVTGDDVRDGGDTTER